MGIAAAESLASPHANHKPFMTKPFRMLLHYPMCPKTYGYFSVTSRPPLNQQCMTLPQCSDPHIRLIALEGKNNTADKTPSGTNFSFSNASRDTHTSG